MIPGKKAPIILKEGMIENMQPGSVIYDLAAIQGGNTAYTKVDEIIDKNGVKIMGEKIYLINFQYHHLIFMQKIYLILSQIFMIKKIKKLILI